MAQECPAQALNADEREQQVQRDVDRDEHQGDLHGVLERRDENVPLLLVAGAVLTLAEAVDVLVGAQERMQEQVGEVAQRDAQQRLTGDDEQQRAHADAVLLGQRREQDGQHLVRRGEEYGEERPQGDNAASV